MINFLPCAAVHASRRSTVTGIASTKPTAAAPPIVSDAAPRSRVTSSPAPASVSAELDSTARRFSLARRLPSEAGAEPCEKTWLGSGSGLGDRAGVRVRVRVRGRGQGQGKG